MFMSDEVHEVLYEVARLASCRELLPGWKRGSATPAAAVGK